MRWHKPVSALRLLGSRPLACTGTPLPAKDIPMTAITWSEALALKQPRMDQTHREFIELLQALAAAPGAGTTDFDPLLAELQTHTEAHFAQEERWMGDIGFEAENCHSGQHKQVLHVLREVRRVLAEGQADKPPELIQVLVEELHKWFVAHAQMMDGALAELMLQRGYDPETGVMLYPPQPEAAAISGCGGSSCS